MPLLSVGDIPSGPLTPGQALARAEAQVAAYLCPGLPDLEVTSWTAEYRPRNDQRAYGVPRYGTRVIGPGILRRWPITGLTGVTVDGVDVTAQCAFDTFSVRRDALAPEFGGLNLVSVVFQTGWTAQTLPAAIREAIGLVAQGISDNPQGLKSERLGDVQNVYGDMIAGFPTAVATLLIPWRYVGV